MSIPWSIHSFLCMSIVQILMKFIPTSICFLTFLSFHVLTIQVKWICPTAPTRPVTFLGGFACTACKLHKLTASFLSQKLDEHTEIYVHIYINIRRVWCWRDLRRWPRWLGGFRCFSSTYRQLLVCWTFSWYTTFVYKNSPTPHILNSLLTGQTDRSRAWNLNSNY